MSLMTELVDLKVLNLGPRIAIVDDVEGDGMPLGKAFDDLDISNHFYKVDIIEPDYPSQPMKDVEMVFLDLHFLEGFGAQFDAYLCINWIERIVPQGQKYVLVVWSRDVEHTEELLATMETMNVTRPFYTGTKRKLEYREAGDKYDIQRLLRDVGAELQQEVEIQIHDFYGEVLLVEEDTVLINCLLNENPKIFEVRRFELQPFKKYIELTPSSYIHIKVTTKPGSTSIEFSPENSDMADKFMKPDIEDFGDPSWLNTPEK